MFIFTLITPFFRPNKLTFYFCQVIFKSQISCPEKKCYTHFPFKKHIVEFCFFSENLFILIFEQNFWLLFFENFLKFFEIFWNFLKSFEIFWIFSWFFFNFVEFFHRQKIIKWGLINSYKKTVFNYVFQTRFLFYLIPCTKCFFPTLEGVFLNIP